MKKNFKLIGIFALTALIGFVMIGCSLVDPLDTSETPWALATGSQGTPRPTTALVTVDGVSVRVTTNSLRLNADNIYVFSEADSVSGVTLWYTLSATGVKSATAYPTFILAANAAITADAKLEPDPATGSTRDLANSFFQSGHTYNFFAVVTPASGDTLAAAGNEVVLPSLSWHIGPVPVPNTAPAHAGFVSNTTFVDWWAQLKRFVAEVEKLSPAILEVTQVATWLTGVNKYIDDNSERIDNYIEAIAEYVDPRVKALTDYIEADARPWNVWIKNPANSFPTLATSFADVATAGGVTLTYPTTPAFPDDIASFTGTLADPETVMAPALWGQITSWVSLATTRYLEDGTTPVLGSNAAWIGAQLTPPARPSAQASGTGAITMSIIPGADATGAQRGINRVTGQNTIVRFPGASAGNNIIIGETGTVGTMHIYWTGTSRVTFNAEALRSGAITEVNSFVGVGAGKLVFTSMNTAATGGLATFAPVSLSAWNVGDQFITLTGITATSRLTIAYQ